MIENTARLHTAEAAVGVDIEHAVHVLRKVHDHRDIAALAGQTRPGAARENRRTMGPRQSHSGFDVLRMARNHHAYRYLPIIRSVGGVERA
jgi:hypothetical protein